MPVESVKTMQKVIDDEFVGDTKVKSMAFRCSGDEVFIKTSDKEGLAYLHGEYSDGVWLFDEHWPECKDCPEGIKSINHLLTVYGY